MLQIQKSQKAGRSFYFTSWNSSIETQGEESKIFDNAARLKQVREMAKGYAEPWKSAFWWLPEDQLIWYFGLIVVGPARRSSSMGYSKWKSDAERGQGLNQSITDAGNLVELLKIDASQSSAIAKYEEEMVARAGEEVHLSIVNTTILHDWSKVLEVQYSKKL